MSQEAAIYYYAGALRHPGTNLSTSITGDCSHRHRSQAAAARCIAQTDAAIRRGHGQYAHSGRQIVSVRADGSRSIVPFGDEA